MSPYRPLNIIVIWLKVLMDNVLCKSSYIKLKPFGCVWFGGKHYSKKHNYKLIFHCLVPWKKFWLEKEIGNSREKIDRVRERKVKNGRKMWFPFIKKEKFSELFSTIVNVHSVVYKLNKGKWGNHFSWNMFSVKPNKELKWDKEVKLSKWMWYHTCVEIVYGFHIFVCESLCVSL